MNKEYQYRSHIKKMQWFPIVFMVLGLSLFVIGFFLPEGEEGISVSILGMFFGLYFYLFFYIFRRMATTRITLSDDGVRFKNNKKDFTIRYEEIQQLDSKSIRNMGGFLIIRKDKKTSIKLTVVIEHVHDLILNLKQQLDQRELNVYNEDKLFQFYKTSYYSDTSWERMYYLFKWCVLHGVIIIGFIVTFFIIDPRKARYETFFTGVSLSFFAFFVYFIKKEIFDFANDIKQNVDQTTWDVPVVDPVFTGKQLHKPLIVLNLIIVVLFFYALFI